MRRVQKLVEIVINVFNLADERAKLTLVSLKQTHFISGYITSHRLKPNCSERKSRIAMVVNSTQLQTNYSSALESLVPTKTI